MTRLPSVGLALVSRAPSPAIASGLLVVALGAICAPPSSFAANRRAAPDLSISMVDAPDAVAPGKVLTYRITVGATGRKPASSVSVQSSVPVGTTFEEFVGPAVGWTFATPPQGGTGPVTATASTLVPDRLVVLQLTVRVSADLPDEATISNTATVSGARNDPNPADNSAATTTTVRAEPPSSADVLVNLFSLQAPVASGELLVTTARLGNIGPMAATDVALTSPVPVGTVFVSALSSGGRLTTPEVGTLGDVVCNIDSIPPDRLVIVSIVLRVTASTGVQLQPTSTVSSSSVDPVPGNNEDRLFVRVVEATTGADVSIAITDVPERVATGDDLSYGAVVRNDGPAAVDPVTALLPVPRGARFRSAFTETGETRVPEVGLRGAVTWRIGALQPGESATIAVTVRVRERSGIPLAVTGLVTSRAADTDLTNNTSAVETRVQSLGDAVILWNPPDPSSGDPAPPPSNVVVDPSALGVSGERAAARSVARDDAASPIGYNVYVSSTPNVATTAENLFTSVPPNQTTVTAPVAPGGSFFTVTATYTTGESEQSNTDGTGDQSGATISSVTVTSSQITAKGSGFTDTVEVLLDGIPFADPAKVKGANAKAVQKGSLAIGQTLDQYLATGTSFLIIYRNSDGKVTTYEYNSTESGREPPASRASSAL